jgi:hypothetical protein
LIAQGKALGFSIKRIQPCKGETELPEKSRNLESSRCAALSGLKYYAPHEPEASLRFAPGCHILPFQGGNITTSNGIARWFRMRCGSLHVQLSTDLEPPFRLVKNQ